MHLYTEVTGSLRYLKFGVLRTFSLNSLETLLDCILPRYKLQIWRFITERAASLLPMRSAWIVPSFLISLLVKWKCSHNFQNILLRKSMKCFRIFLYFPGKFYLNFTGDIITVICQRYARNPCMTQISPSISWPIWIFLNLLQLA